MQYDGMVVMVQHAGFHYGLEVREVDDHAVLRMPRLVAWGTREGHFQYIGVSMYAGTIAIVAMQSVRHLEDEALGYRDGPLFAVHANGLKCAVK